MGRIAEPVPKRKRGISLLAMIERECLAMTNGGEPGNNKSWPPKKEVTPVNPGSPPCLAGLGY